MDNEGLEVETRGVEAENEGKIMKNNIESLVESTVPDIKKLSINSRLNTNKKNNNEGDKTGDGINVDVDGDNDQRANGLPPINVNGISKSPSENDELLSLPQSVQTSHLNELHDIKCTGKNDIDIEYVSYTSELQMPDIMKLIQKDLSEPYSIYTYRYFIHNWPKLCFLAMHGDECVGAIVCKLDIHRKIIKRGYIAMLAVDIKYRKRKIGSNLVKKAIRVMIEDEADEVVLETEITNRTALRLYENLGFVRDKRLFRYYLNGVDALRLKLWLR